MPDPHGRTDLVVEMQQRKLAEQQAEQAKLQEVQQAQQAKVRAARTRSLITSLVMVVVLVILGVLGWLGFNAYRIGNVLETARAQVNDGTPEALPVAIVSLEQGLEISPEHPEVRGLMALVVAQQAIDGFATVEAVEAAVGGADEGSEAAVAKAILAVLQGRYEDATAALPQAAPDGEDAGALRRAIAWVKAQVALNDLDNAGGIEAALAGVDAALEEAPGWDRNHRAGAALAFAAGQVERAYERLDQARELRPADNGVLVDRALYDAVLHRDVGGIDKLVTQLLDAGVLPPMDGGRAKLARAIARQIESDDDDRSGLDKVYGKLAAGDLWARSLALEAGLDLGAAKEAKGWIEQGLPPASTELYGAWVDFGEDRVKESLERTAKLEQGHPRVALVQGLALVEQRRFEEGRKWLERAGPFAERPSVKVAMARIDAQLGDAAAAAERLEAQSKSQPRAPRVWTGLAEALTKGAKDGEVPSSAEKPLQTALKQEAYPTHAAYLLSRLRQSQADKKPSQMGKAIELRRRAAKERDWMPLYREQLGLLLVEEGSRDEAREVLTSLADDPAAGAEALLKLSELAAEHAVAEGKAPPAEIATWLALAAQRGADPNQMTYTKARIALTSGTPDGLVQARAWIGPMLQANAKDMEARLLYIETLRRQGSIADARASVLTGLRKTPDDLEGRLHLAWGQLESTAGKKRQAAGYGYKGWRSMVKEPRPANELIEAARLNIDWWQAVRNSGTASSVGKGLTRRVPHRAEAWVLRSGAQLEDGEAGKACKSASKAIELDDTLMTAYDAKADCQLRLRDRAGAAKTLEAAAKKAPNEAKAKALKRRARKLR